MYRQIDPPTLRTGDRVTAAVIHAPDRDWAERIERFLQHKGWPWTWQTRELLRTDAGLDARFFILHEGGRPFANVMLARAGGIALLGHVWTEPAYRGAGASTWLMERARGEFLAAGGRAMFLGTGYDTMPWHFYRRHGFEPVEPGSGCMAWHRASRDAFEEEWFAGSAATIEPLGWSHWPTSAPLFLGAEGGDARLVANPLFGRDTGEAALLLLLRQLARGREPAARPAMAWVLRDRDSAAVFGLASRTPDPHWPHTEIVDLFCHHRWWHRAADLLAALPLSEDARTLAHCDARQVLKRTVLESAGFREVARLPAWIKAGGPAGARIDISVLARE